MLLLKPWLTNLRSMSYQILKGPHVLNRPAVFHDFRDNFAATTALLICKALVPLSWLWDFEFHFSLSEKLVVDSFVVFHAYLFNPVWWSKIFLELEVRQGVS